MKRKMHNDSTITGCNRALGKICVVGAGAAGLVVAEVLARNGLDVTVFEQEDEVGGVWRYRPGRYVATVICNICSRKYSKAWAT